MGNTESSNNLYKQNSYNQHYRRQINKHRRNVNQRIPVNRSIHKNRQNKVHPQHYTNQYQRNNINKRHYGQYSQTVNPQQRQQIQPRQYQQPQQQKYRHPNQNTQDNYIKVQQKDVSYTPYDIFSISKDDIEKGSISEEQLKKQYRKLALKYHPDKRGGDTQQFEIIKNAYNDLVVELRKKTKYTDTKNQPVVNPEYQKNDREQQVDSMIKNFEPVHIDKNNMDINKFNKVFQDFKIDTPFNDGYGNMMEKSMSETSKGKFNVQYQSQVNSSMNDRQFFNNDFSQQNFNSSFENKVKIGDVNDENSKVIIYKEPQSIMAQKSLGFVELGQDKVNDFTSGMNSNLNCTDYKQAYYHQNTISDKVKHVDISNKASSIGKIKTERANVSYKMSNEDQEYYERVKKENEQKELQRQERLKYRDNLIGDNFHQMNRLVIKDKR
jgi:curved DNA-binding protein CbpA